MPIADWFKRSKEKNFEGKLVVDNPDFKVASVTCEGKPLLLGIGITEERQVEGEGSVNTTGVKGKYQTQKGMKWQVLYDKTQFPNMMPLEDVKVIAASTVALTSGGTTAVQGILQGEFKEEKTEDIHKLENRLQMWRERKRQLRNNLAHTNTTKEDYDIIIKEWTTVKNKKEKP